MGDANGDNKLDVSVVTREGWSFLWRTNVPACHGSNDEWWTFHHDEHNTANYGTDARPPGSPTDLRAVRNRSGSVTLAWKQPGDDLMCGRAARYQVIASADPILHPGDGHVIAGGDASGPAGTSVTRTLSRASIGNARHVAVLYRDEAGNWGIKRGASVPPLQGNRRAQGSASGQ